MAESFSPIQFQTLVNDTTAVTALNSNFAAIANLFTDVLSRGGSLPNQMTSTLDMNSNQIINLPPPATANSPARLVDVTPVNATPPTALLSSNNVWTGTNTFGSPVTINTPCTMTGNNTYAGNQTFNIPTGTQQGFTLTQTFSGSAGSSITSTQFNLIDSVNAGTNFVSTFQVNNTFGGSTAQGGRTNFFSGLTLNGATNSSNANRNYTSIAGALFLNTNDGGTSPNSNSTSNGVFLAGNFQYTTSSSAPNLQVISSCEFNSNMAAGSSAWFKTLCNFAGGSSDFVNGTVINCMAYFYNLANTAKWSQAILIDNFQGAGFFPVASTGTLIKAATGSVAIGLDFTGMTFSANAIATTGFFVTGAGVVTLGAVGGTSGIINLLGSTSGTVQITTNATGTLLALPALNTIGFNGAASNARLSLFGLTSGGINIFVNSTATFLTIDQPLQIGQNGGSAGSLTLAGSSTGSVQLTTPATSGGQLQFNSAGSFSANGAVATALTSIGPTGSHTTVQTWLTIVDNTGATRYIPCF